MKTLFVGQNSIHLDSVDSTNSYATRMLRQISLIDGTLFYTFDQHSGRGQRENKWEAEPHKNIALSVVLAPSFLKTDQQFLLTRITSLALADLMAEMVKNKGSVSIKWPNDIYVNEKKICGVLIENMIKGSSIQYAVIGVGINVNQERFNAAPQAVSLKNITGETYDLKTIIDSFCSYLEAYYLQLKAGKIKEINEKYLSTLYRRNVWADYFFDNASQKAMIKGVTDEGRLILELKDGTNRMVDLKEIQFL